MAKNSFRKPVILDEDGGYITKAQIRFFMNRRRGFEKIENIHDDFVQYTDYCKVYNFLWDCSEAGDEVRMFWDPEKDAIAFTLPKKGTIADVILKWTNE